ncbi:MAG: alpha/beta fold hydrolase, partial [Atopobiaceae bacterium]|nr:alpha/beta fold hydrolase [Atopobiaceae bacterium]
MAHRVGQATEFAKNVIWNERDGKSIYGEVFLPASAEKSADTGEAFPTVILVHGLGSDTTHMEPYARLLAQHGFVAYAFDFCGGGLETKSDGSTLEMTVMTEKEDLLAAVDMMLGQPYVDKHALFLLGNSQGGYVSAMVAEEMPETFRALALIYPGFVLRDSVLMR